MPNYVHRTTKQFLRSIAPADLPEALANYIQDPDLSALAGVPNKYWNISGDTVSEMSRAEKDVVDAAELSSLRDSIADQMNNQNDRMKALALVLLAGHNQQANRINAILAAAESATNLATFKAAMNAISDAATENPAGLRDRVRAELDNT